MGFGYSCGVVAPLESIAVMDRQTASLSPATVLVVDDEPFNLDVIQHFLQAEGLRVALADDGETALQAVRAQPPDLILLDVMMPGLDGFEVCRRLKEEPATAFIPVVILTALKGDQERVRGAQAGADEFLSKPFDHVELVTRVKALVRSKRYHDQILAHNAMLEQRVAERTTELKYALEELRRLDRLKNEFIANVSHELRTPMLHVKGYLDLVADGAMGQLTSKQVEGLALVQDAITRLNYIVDDIVDFSSLNAEPLAFEPLYLSDICRNVLLGFSAAAARRNVSLTLSIAPDVPRVLGDRVAITRALRHLVDNAIKFGPRYEAVQIVVARSGERVQVAVRDHGPGLAPEELAHIFNVFYQVDGSMTRQAGGLGVGLALVRKLVQAHGSDIKVKSEQGRGSQFYFDLAISA
jgi:signal transduction histidine kinase